jgi:1-acyl-sn-glycerol-3-phosphate acyltransferase
VSREIDGWWTVAHATVRTVANAAFRIRVSGSRNIPRTGGALMVYNHVSVLDAIFVGLPMLRVGRTIRCFALAEEFEKPLLGRALRSLDQIPIRRGAGAWEPLEEMADVIGGGGLAGIAPEGTVGTGEELQPMQKGAARIALLAGGPFVPIGLWGTQRRWPKAGLHYHGPLRPTVGVAIGRPVAVDGDPKSRLDVQALTDGIREALAEAVRIAQRLAPGPS